MVDRMSDRNRTSMNDTFKSDEERELVSRMLNLEPYLNSKDRAILASEPYSYPIALTGGLKGSSGLAHTCKTYGTPLLALLTRNALTIPDFEVFDGAAESLLLLDKKLSLYVNYILTFSSHENQRSTGLTYLAGLSSDATLERGRALIFELGLPPDHANEYLKCIAESDLPVAKKIAGEFPIKNETPTYLQETIHSILSAPESKALYSSLEFDKNTAGKLTKIFTAFTMKDFEEVIEDLKSSHENLLVCVLTALTNHSAPEARAAGLESLCNVNKKFGALLAKTMVKDPDEKVRKVATK